MRRHPGLSWGSAPIMKWNWKLITGIATGVVICLVGVVLAVKRHHPRPPVTVTLRLAVTPPQQSAYVAGIANSARFKYVLGKQAGIKPALAQKLEAKAPANSPIVEARLGVLTKEEGQRCLEAFARTLQVLCGTQARITVIERSLD